MSRRDTIILSVLINAGLLAVLFATAWNSDDDSLETKTETNQTLVQAERPGTSTGAAAVVARPQASAGATAVAQPVAVAAAATQHRAEAHTSSRHPQSTTTPPAAVATATPSTPRPATAAPSRPRPTPAAPEVLTITVKRGDFLGKIASANGTTVEQIVELNNLSSTQLQIGQKLKVPKNTTPATAARPTQRNTGEIASADLKTYTVQNGDNPWVIARKHNIGLSDLLRLNGLDEDSARNLRVGQKLRVKE